jgi:hypothetical protein
MANSKKMKNSVAGGGRAEATGANYETLVATWYCVRILAGAGGEPPAGLPTGVRLVSLRCQTEAPVDDALITTSSNGFLFIQAKRSIDLSAAETSVLASVLDQFIRQHKACEEGQTGDRWARPLDRDRDRLILATPARSSTKITEVLARLLRGVRERADAELLSDVQTSARDREVADVVEAHIRRI